MSVPARIDPLSPSSAPVEWTNRNADADDPTGEMAAALTRAYGFYNTHLFSGALPPCLITLQRKPRTYGYFVAQRFARASQTNGMLISDEIAMNPAHFLERSLTETLSTLVHEMVHLAQHHFGKPARGRYHNREWARMMKLIGLYPSHSGQPGGKETGDSVSHYVVEGGPFAQATEALLADGFAIPWADALKRELGGNASGSGSASKSGKRTKFVCPACGLNAWAKADAMLTCGFDGAAMAHASQGT